MFNIIKYAILFFFTCLFSTVFVEKLLRKRNMIKNPPTPLRLPIIGHLHLLSPVFHKALYHLSKQYGPIFRVFLGSVPCVIVSSSEFAKEFFKSHEISFTNRPKISSIHYLTYNSQDFAFSPYGSYWKFMKKLCMSKLLGNQTLNMVYPIRRDEVKHLIESISRQSSSGNRVDVRGELIRMMNNVISRMVMSKRCSGDENEAVNVRKLIEDGSKICGKFNVSDTFWFCKRFDFQGFEKKLKKVRNEFDEMMEMIIEEHKMERRKGKGNGVEDVKDVLDMLLDISEDENTEIKLTGDNIKAFIMDLFSGGTDTSAIAIEWALAELIHHPNIMKKAAQELDSVVGKNRLIQESDVVNLPYLQAIVKETLRLHPPGGPFIMRESNQDFLIKGYHISSKTRLLFHVWAIGRDPNYWDNPLEFKPERFVNEEGKLKGELDFKGQNYNFLPFGSGRRGCPGTSLAIHVVQSCLGAMIQCFEWNGEVNMEEGPTATLPMAYPLFCVPMPRFTPLPLH